MGWLGMSEIIVILLLVLILFGPKKLPEIGRIIGNGLREFRKATQGFDLDGILDAKETSPSKEVGPEKEESKKAEEAAKEESGEKPSGSLDDTRDEGGASSRPMPEKLTESPDPAGVAQAPYEQPVSAVDEACAGGTPAIPG
jgi:sec-independent protein translocase protein TatA